MNNETKIICEDDSKNKDDTRNSVDGSRKEDNQEDMDTHFLKYSRLKHLMHCLALFSLIFLMEYTAFEKHQKNLQSGQAIDSWIEYGIVVTLFCYSLKMLVLLALPQSILNFLGLVCYNAFPGKVILKTSPLISPVICFRVVTRGDYPELIKLNLQRNLKTCFDAGLEHFFIEVVSDKVLNLKPHRRVRELVVPESYKTSSEALYKSRALQFCLEPTNNLLADDDWIVHLDEETLLTVNSIKGILNFAMDGQHQLGQGLITYANEKIVNWLTTLADNFRVTDDMGKLRFQLKFFHKPLFSFKGSYVVTQFKTERTVTFDNGPEGSIAEDCYFAIKAFSMGYSFDFIEGEMWEKSPFTIIDFIQQRKRWVQGILLIVHSKKIPIKYKALLGTSLYAWIVLPLILLNFLVVLIFPMETHPLLEGIVHFVGAMNVYMFLFGALKSFSLKRQGFLKYWFFVSCSVAVIPINVCLESIAVVWGEDRKSVV